MRRHLQGLHSQAPKRRTRSPRPEPTPRPRLESPSSVSAPETEPIALAHMVPSGLTTVEKAGAAAQGVAKGLAAGLGTELAIGFVAGATGVAASTILWILLPVPIYAIATHWDSITRKASRLYLGKGTLDDYEAAGEVAGGLLSIGAAGSRTDVGIESGQAVGEAFGALCSNESRKRRGRRETCMLRSG